MSEIPEQKPKKRALSPAGWLAVIALGAILGAAGWFAVQGWFGTPDRMTTHGYVAMILGIVFSVALGAGLMALVFYSNRKGYDDRVQ